MARITNTPFAAAPTPIKRDPLLDLDRLLSRLEQNILHANADLERRLRRDEYERTKTRYNIETARKWLTTLEQDALGIKIHSRRQELQANLNKKRGLINELFERVDDLENMGWDDEDSDSEGEDLLADIIETPSESTGNDGVDTEAPDAAEGAVEEPEIEAVTEHSPPAPSVAQKEQRDTSSDRPQAAQGAPETATSQTLRARGRPNGQELEQDTAQTTSSKLFEGRRSTSISAVATEEAMLDHHRHEQEALSEDILRMAKALKEKSMTTARLLEEDKDILDRAGEGMYASDRGMESAGRKMSALTRMTEGRGWIGRMMLYGMVWGMMLMLVLIFIFLPKLRL